MYKFYLPVFFLFCFFVIAVKKMMHNGIFLNLLTFYKLYIETHFVYFTSILTNFGQ